MMIVILMIIVMKRVIDIMITVMVKLYWCYINHFDNKNDDGNDTSIQNDDNYIKT